MVSMILGVSLTVSYLGSERFGMWMTIASFTTMLAFLDLGTGNALTNHVARHAAAGHLGAVRDAVSGGLGFLALIGVSASILLTLVAAFLPWDLILKQNNATAEAQQSAMLFGLLFGLNILSSGIQKVFTGLQRGFEVHATSAVGSIITIVALIVATKNHAGVPILLLSTLGSQIIVSLALFALLIKRKQFSFNGLVDRTKYEANQLMNVGLMFLVVQVGAMIGWGADNLIISSTLGVSFVAAYSVTQRLMQFVSIPLSMVNAPLWPSYADAYARGDAAFIRGTLRRSLKITFFSGIFGAAIVSLLAERLIVHWTQGAVQVNSDLIFAFAIWTILDATGNAFAMFLNGCGIIRPQAMSVIFFCVIVTPMKFYFANHFGASGILTATIICYLIAVPLLYFTIFKTTVTDAIRSCEGNFAL